MIAHAAAQHVVPGRSREDTQDPEERIGDGKTEKSPKVAQGEESKIAQADREPGPLGREGRAETLRADDAGEDDAGRRNACDETAAEGSRGEAGKLLT